MERLSSAVAPSVSSSSTAAGDRQRRLDPEPCDSLTRESAASEMHHPPSRSSLAMLNSSAAAAAATTGSRSPLAAAAFGPLALDEAHRCRYKTGKCSNARSSKRNGQPHQLCLYHRDKANQIQRKFDRQKRQVLRERKNSGSTSTTASTPPSSASSSPAAPRSASATSSRSSTALSTAHRSPLQQLQYMQPHQPRRSSATAMLHNYPHHPISAGVTSTSHSSITSFAPRFTSLAAKDVDLYSDSEASSRFSTDSSSSDSSASLWADLPSPVSAAAFMGLRLAPSTLRIATPSPVARTTTAASSSPSPHPLSHDELDFLCSAMFE